jgi:TfoX/Sxy family transcriptional regulator of competence genes
VGYSWAQYWRMALDEELAERIRGHLGDVPVTEKRMFGGLAFLVGGNMAVAASGQGGLMVRVDPEQSEDLVARRRRQPHGHARTRDGRLAQGHL